MEERDIIVLNKIYNPREIIMNTTIMEYASRYVESIKNKVVVIQKINRVRLHKHMYLPFELVNIDGGQPTNSYYNIEEQSSI